MNLNHQLASAFVPVVLPVSARLNTELVDRLVDVITFQVSLSISYRNPNSSKASIRSIISVSRVLENEVVRFGIIALITDPSGTTLFNVTGPTPVSRLPFPPLAPSKTTAPIFAQSLSSASSVPAVTKVLFKNSLVSGDVNFINAPGLAYFRFEVAESPITRAPPDVKNPVFVFVEVVVEFHVVVSPLTSLVAYFR